MSPEKSIFEQRRERTESMASLISLEPFSAAAAGASEWLWGSMAPPEDHEDSQSRYASESLPVEPSIEPMPFSPAVDVRSRQVLPTPSPMRVPAVPAVEGSVDTDPCLNLDDDAEEDREDRAIQPVRQRAYTTGASVCLSQSVSLSTCCYDLTKGTQDKDFSYLFFDSLSQFSYSFFDSLSVRLYSSHISLSVSRCILVSLSVSRCLSVYLGVSECLLVSLGVSWCL